MNDHLSIIIPGEPHAQGRPRFVSRGKFVKAYDPAKSRTWKAYAQDHMGRAMSGRAPLTGPLAVCIVATFTCPRSDHRKRRPRRRRWHAKRPDADNVAKGVMDAAKGVVWLDDTQVAHLTVAKVIADQDRLPSVVVAVQQLPAESSLLPAQLDRKGQGVPW